MLIVARAGTGYETGALRGHSLFHAGRPVPAEHRANFRHLYLDIAWFGVLSASAMSFVAIYATHQGANAFQLGLLSAGPAVVNLFVTLPAGRWLEKQSMSDAVLRMAAAHRFFYLLWVFLPFLLGAQAQVWALIGLTLLMSVPGAVLSVGFNALFAQVVPPEWRGHVVGVRNALLSVTFILISLLCGLILDRLPFPASYQVVFGIGSVGAIMSTVHLRFVAPGPSQPRPRVGRSLGDLARPGTVRTLAEALRPGAALRFLVRRRKPGNGSLRASAAEVLQGSFGRLLAVLFAFYLAVHLAIPLFPLHWVNSLGLSDREIGLGTAVFYGSVFVASTQLERLVRRQDNRRITAIGAMLMASYPALMALAPGVGLFLVGSASGGLGWALVSGALTNYMLETIPADRRPAYLAWYNLTLNAALLLGSLTGPVIAGLLGVPAALLLFAGLRFLAALGILGRQKRQP